MPVFTDHHSLPVMHSIKATPFGLVLLSCLACESSQFGSPTAAVTQKPLVDLVLLSGEIRAGEAIELIAPMVGMWPIPIQSILDNGTEVRAGEAIAEFDNSNLVGGLDASRERAQQAATSLLATRARLAGEEATARFEVQSKDLSLNKAKIEASIPEGLESDRKYQEKQLALRRAQLDLTAAQTEFDNQLIKARAEIGIAKVERDKARAEVERTEQSLEVVVLEAPRDGILEIAYNREEGRPYRTGDNVQPGRAVALFPDYTSLRVEAFLFDVDQGRVQAGAPATIILDAYPEDRFTGRVTEIQEIAQQPSTRSARRIFRVLVELDNSDANVMRIGMSARVEILSKLEQWQGKPTLVVPRGALDFSVRTTHSTPLLEDQLATANMTARLNTPTGWVPADVGLCSLTECVVAGPEAGLEVQIISADKIISSDSTSGAAGGTDATDTSGAST